MGATTSQQSTSSVVASSSPTQSSPASSSSSSLSSSLKSTNQAPSAFGRWRPEDLCSWFSERASDNSSLGLFAGHQRVPLREVSVEGQLRDQCLEMRLRHTYENDTESPLECVFRFEAVAGSVLCGLEVLLPDGKRIVGKIKEKTKAAAKYDDSIASGHGAYLLEKVGRDAYRMSVGNLPPKGKVTVFPLYDGNLRVILPSALLPSSFSSFALKVNVSHSLGVGKIVSPTHKIASSEGQSRVVTFKTDQPSQLRNSTGALVIDVELQKPSEPTVVVEIDKETGAQSAVVSFHPTWEIDLDRQKFASEIIFLVDRSGSMSGSSIDYARQTMQLFLRSLPEGVSTLFDSSVDYNEKNLALATAHVESMQADLGGTDLHRPLSYIYASRYDVNYPRQIFILTDGEVDDRVSVIQSTELEAGSTRVFTFGIGSSVDTTLVSGLARAGRGAAEFIQDSADMKVKVMRQLERALEPMLRNITITWQAKDSRADWKSTPFITRPLFNGERMVSFGILAESNGEEPALDSVKIEGIGPDGQLVRWELPVKSSNVISGNVISRLAAATRIRDIETKKSEHFKDGTDVSAETLQHIKQEVLSLSLKHGLVSQEASFIAVEDREEATEGSMVPVDVSNTSSPSSPPVSQFFQRARLMNSPSSSSASSSSKLARAQLLAQETEDIGADVLLSLTDQRDQLMMLSERLDSIDSAVDCAESAVFMKRASKLSSGGIGAWFSSLVAPLSASMRSASPPASSSWNSNEDDDAALSSSNLSISSSSSSSSSASSSRSSTGSQGLVAKQKASGAWDLDDVAATLGKQSDQLIDAFLKIFTRFKKEDFVVGKDSQLEMILGTALAIEALHARFASEQDEWGLVARKGRAWLKKTLASRGLTGDGELDELLQAARQCV